MKNKNKFFKIFNKKLIKYGDWLDDLHNNKSLFVPYTDAPFQRKSGTPKIFAYYLTQFHAVPENDNAHGRGFTEWTNVASCAPLFVGHFQPKIPYDVGFYNLLDAFSAASSSWSFLFRALASLIRPFRSLILLL